MSEQAPHRTTDNPQVQRAVRTVSRAAWGMTYQPNRGPFHFATGYYWPEELRRLANQWEKWAVAARIVADEMEKPVDTEATSPVES